MYGHFGFEDSVQKDNGYQFHCPVVDRDALFLVCAFKRTKFMRGDEFAAHDCRCAMTGNKCPAMRMLQWEWRNNERRFYDPDGGKHMLPKDILEQIERVVLLPSHQGNYPVAAEQAERLFDNKLHVGRVAGEAESIEAPRKPKRKRAVKADKATELPVEQADEIAVDAGDMGAMLNQALRQEARE